MSGFTGIIHLDGAPADPAILEGMTHLAQKHGDGRCDTWVETNAGLGHCLLRTTPESATERQPFSFDGKRWIVGDARVDERRPLVAALQARDRPASLSRPDIELILHAFHAWGERCVEQFYGDFAFVIWDQHAQRLFCARDSFGIKPFYYARTGATFVFSNNLDSLRAVPGISLELNEAALCDFLAFGYNLDEKATFFKQIARLPPAHTLSLAQSGPAKIHAYQRLVFDQRLQCKNPQEYQEQFIEIFQQAVSDRLRTDRVAFELSGGLDSTSVASVAALEERENPAFSGLAVTTDYSWSDPNDREAHYAGMVAQQTGMQHLQVQAGTKNDFMAPCGTQQPYTRMYAVTSGRFAALVRRHGRVMLTGQGGDPLMDSSGFPLLDQYRELPLPAFTAALIRSAGKKRSLHGLGLSALTTRDPARIRMPAIPAWIKSDLLRRAASPERWHELFYRPGRYPPRCRHEMAYDELRLPVWTYLFEDYYQQLFCGIDCRHALFDIRLINFFFAVPPSLKQDKALLRDAMQGRLPEAVRRRPKTVFSSDMTQSLLNDTGTFSKLDLALKNCASWIDRAVYLKALRRYARGAGGDHFVMLSPLDLNQWINDQ